MIKYILLGIGIGIFISALMLFIYCAIQLNSSKDDK